MTSTSDIRNLALVGHGNAGKTTAAEALLFLTKANSRWGKVDDKTSVMDYLDDEKSRGYSINTAIATIKADAHTINVVDAPGKPDFFGEVVQALSTVETAVVCVAANSGVQVNTRNAYKRAEHMKLARAILVTKVDAENVRIEEVMKQIHDVFGDKCMPATVCIGEGTGLTDIVSAMGPSDNAEAQAAYEALCERVVEADDAVMEKFLETMEVDEATFHRVFRLAVAKGIVVPVFFASLPKEKGYDLLLHGIKDYFPAPDERQKLPPVYDHEPYHVYRDAQRKVELGQHDESSEQVVGGEPGADGEAGAPAATELKPPPVVDLPDEFVAQVIKVVIDQHVGKIAFLRVWKGEAASGSMLHNPSTGKSEKFAHFGHAIGHNTADIEKAIAGDIVVVKKMESLHLGQTVTAHANTAVAIPRYPTPMVAFAVTPKTQKDVDKLGDALRRMTEEDPTFGDRTDSITKERIIAGLSELHLNILLERLKTRYKVDVDTAIPKVPYRETCTGNATGSFRHKKQSGGSGEFAEVHMEIAPSERGKGVVFEDAIFGGAIDRQFIPAVEKGVRDQATRGIVAGFPVVDIHVKLFDGKTHPVDSKDRAFQKAGRECLKEIFKKAKPKLMEPVMEIEVTVPSDDLGSILGDLTGQRRGRPIDQSTEGNLAILKAHVPLKEVQTYSQTLQSITGGEGSYTLKPAHYDVVPDTIAQTIMAAYKADDDDD